MMKSSRRISMFVLVALLLVLILVASPAAATQPEELELTATIYFDVASGTMHGTGTWSSSGFIDSSGVAEEDHFVAGWPPGYFFKTAHLTETWEDDYGTITIQTQLNVDDWIINAFNDVHMEGSGQWVVKSSDGAYENLKGGGRVSFVGDITPDSCPEPYSPCYLISVEEYEGLVHFDP
jgi:hypothetical protein